MLAVHVHLHLLDLGAQLLLLLVVQCVHIACQLTYAGGELLDLLFQSRDPGIIHHGIFRRGQRLSQVLFDGILHLGNLRSGQSWCGCFGCCWCPWAIGQPWVNCIVINHPFHKIVICFDVLVDAITELSLLVLAALIGSL